MRMSWKLGRVAGIDLYLHPTFLLLMAFVGLTSRGSAPWAMALTVAAFGCVLLHELGHALMARRFGIATEDITLYPIGGVARLRRMPRAPGSELLIALAGPAVNVAIAATLGLLIAAGSVLDPGLLPAVGGLNFLASLLGINLWLALFNLLPAFPMDGGRVLRALLSLRMGRGRATEVAATLGQVLAVAMPLVLMAVGWFSPFHLILAGFIYMAAGSELAQVRAEERDRRGPDDRDDRGVWFAPAGYRWVNRGPGVWQLAPIPIPVDPYRAPRWR